MPSIFAVANPKGGSGKTTVAIILAGEFAKHGYSTAIVDADPQGSSYQWHASSIARGLSPDGVDLVRAADEKALAGAVDSLGAYDVVVVDTPGYYGEVVIQSALRADLVVLPCKLHTFDASQVVRTIRNLERHAAEVALPMSPTVCSSTSTTASTGTPAPSERWRPISTRSACRCAPTRSTAA